MEENNKLEDYVDILEIFINHLNSGDKTLLRPKQIKNQFGLDKIPSKTKEYEQKKRSLDRCLEFYSIIKLISIKTDTTMNELGRLDRDRKKRFPPLVERKQLDPYIEYIKDVKKKTLTKDKCKLLNSVGRFRKTVEVWIDSKNKEVDISLLEKLPKYIHPQSNVINRRKDTKEVITLKEKELKENSSNPLRDYPIDNNGFYIINDKLKFKIIKKQKLSFEFFGEKFQNITIDVTKDFKDIENKTKNLSKDTVIIDDKEIVLVDMDDTSVRAEDCNYRLSINEKCDTNNPIQFIIPSDSKIDMFVKFLTKMIDTQFTDDGTYEEDITSPMISTIINSNAFSDINKGFIINTVGKLLVETQNNLNTQNKKVGFYPLPLLIELIESNIKVNIEFENNGNVIKLNNTQMKKIIIKENSFDLHFDNFISMNQIDISQIISIINVDKNFDKKRVDELIEELDNSTYKTTFKNMMNQFAYDDIFEF